MERNSDEAPPGYKWIFRPWKTDPNTGTRIYPKAGTIFPDVGESLMTD